MVSIDEFWGILAGYGAAIAPAQYIFYFSGLGIAAWSLLKPGRTSSLILKLYLSIAFAWIGAAFYLTFASAMGGGSRVNFVFAGLFFVVSFLFAADIFKGRMRFTLPASDSNRILLLILLALVFCYPLFGLLSSHEPPILIFPGTYPCPTVALGLLVLVMALPQVDRMVYATLLLCAVPFTPIQVIRYGVFEDIILLASGIFALLMLLRSQRSVQDTL